jgi:hypothetical protein
MRGNGVYMNQISRSKVKVTLTGHWKMLIRSKTFTFIRGFQCHLAQMFTIVRLSIARIIQVPVTNVKVKGKIKTKDVYRDHIVIINWGIVTQIITYMTTSVTHVIKVNICKVNATKYDTIFRYYKYIAQGISHIFISIIPTSLCFCYGGILRQCCP